MDYFLNNTKIKIQWISNLSKEFKRASILETKLGINLDKQKQLISHCAFPPFTVSKPATSFSSCHVPLFPPRRKNDRSISSRILPNELSSWYIGDRWSLRSNKSPMFFHLGAHPFVFFPLLLTYLHPLSLSLFFCSSITLRFCIFFSIFSSPNVKPRGRACWYLRLFVRG